MMDNTPDLFELWRRGVARVDGAGCVAAALAVPLTTAPTHIIAVGKAATAMARAAHAAYPAAPVLIVTKTGHAAGAPPRAQVFEAAHPVPDDTSIAAGTALLRAIDACAADAHLLLLVSGGASALAEVPAPGVSLADIAARTQGLLASGADIATMNAARRTLSRIKGGALLSRFAGARVTTLAISDVQGDALSVIGSGIGDATADASFAFDARIVASNAHARAAIADAAAVTVLSNTEDLYDDVAVLAPRIAARLRTAGHGLTIIGGEPTVVLPPAPGLGGRNMMLALRLAREIAGDPGLSILVAGTDGSDGPTDAAGARIDGTTWDDSGAGAIAAAAPYDWLDARGALLRTGPTGTNVMDLLLAFRARGA